MIARTRATALRAVRQIHVLVDKGIALSAFGRHEEAVTNFEESIAIFYDVVARSDGGPDVPVLEKIAAGVAAGMALTALGRHDVAANTFVAVVALFDIAPDLRSNEKSAIKLISRGLVLANLGQFQAAHTAMREALNLGSEHKHLFRRISESIYERQFSGLVLDETMLNEIERAQAYRAVMPGEATASDQESDPTDAQDLSETNLSEATRLLAKARELGLTVERAIEAMERAAKAETTERASPAPSDDPRPKITGNSPRRRKQYMFTEEELHDPATIDRARDILADAEESRRIRQPISEDQRNDIRWADAFTRRIRKINRPEVI